MAKYPTRDPKTDPASTYKQDRRNQLLRTESTDCHTVGSREGYRQWGWVAAEVYTSAKCKSVRKKYAILPDTLGNITSTSIYFKMLPDSPRSKQCALRLCKSMLRCSWKHLQLWRCIQDTASRIVKFWSSQDDWADLWETSREAETAAQLCGILQERPRPRCGSVGYFESGQDRCSALWESWCGIFTAMVLT